MPELRWCVREDQRIERERLVPATSQGDVDRFNSRVDNYNSRCSDFRYRAGNLERARREVGAGGSGQSASEGRRLIRPTGAEPRESDLRIR